MAKPVDKRTVQMSETCANRIDRLFYRGPAGASCDVQFGQRDALIEIVDAQNWHSFVTVAAGGTPTETTNQLWSCLRTASVSVSRPESTAAPGA